MHSNELVGNAEAAALLGISGMNFCHLRRKMGGTFPAPVAELRCGPIWRSSDIDAFRWTHYRKALSARELLVERIGRLADDEVEAVLRRHPFA